MVIHMSFNGQTSTVLCGATLPVINCKDNVTLNASYTCMPSGCLDTVSYVLTGPVNSSGNLPLVLNSLIPGTYDIFLKARCNGIVCDTCHLFFTVVCDTPCCAYNIKVSGGTVTYTLSPTGNATIASQSFTITGLTGVNLTEVRAEVLSYNLSSNFNNECLGCKTLPFTWASMNSGTNIGAIVPLITLFGGTTPVFSPTGPPLIYQDPREIIWNNGGNIFMLSNSPLGIKFNLPPVPVIDCCQLTARICVKFTFRDDKCRECEVIVCFSVTISK
jgi:hypothetical protein